MHALGSGIDGGQALFHLLGLIEADATVFGVDDLQRLGATAGLAEAAQARSFHQIVLLCRREVKEAQDQTSRAIGDTHQQGAPPSHLHLHQLDLALDHRLVTRTQSANRQYSRAILVSQGKMEQNILYRVNAQPRQFLHGLRPDTLEPGQRQRWGSGLRHHAKKETRNPS